LASKTSSGRRTKLAAMKSTLWAKAKRRSSRSFGRQRWNAQLHTGEIDALMLPERSAIDDAADDFLGRGFFSTRSSMRPSERRMRSPAFTSRGSGRKVVFTRVESPRIFAVVMMNCWPERRLTVAAAGKRARCGFSGPGGRREFRRSCQVRRRRHAPWAIDCAWVSWVPWEKLRRAYGPCQPSRQTADHARRIGGRAESADNFGVT